MRSFAVPFAPAQEWVAAELGVERQTERTVFQSVTHENSPETQVDLSGPDSLDAMTAAASHHKILFENERVRVLETRVSAGDRTPVHTHRWPSVQYVVSWSDIKRYNINGQVVLDSRTAGLEPEIGAAFWSPPIAPHFVENVGTQELCVIAVELKTQ